MAASKYNGVILPALPKTTYPHLLILNTTDDSGNQIYALWVCDQPFKASIDIRDAFCRPKDSNVEVYIANTTSWVWNRGSIGTSGDDTNAEFISVIGEFVWANHNIYMQNSLPPTMPTWDQTNFPYLLLGQDNFVLGIGDAGVTNKFPVWWAWYSAEPFVLDDLTAPEVGEVAGPLGYGGFRYTTDVVGCQGYYLETTLGASGWNTMSNTEITDRLKFDPEEPINNTNFWANHDIVGTNGYEIKANSWFELLCYKVSEPVEVPVPLPIDPAITGGNATYDQYTAAGEMWCTAGTPEGGRLSYKWYRYTDSEENAVVCGYTGTHTPSTLTAGAWHYFCEVTNNQYGGTATVRTVSVPITVNAVELPDNPDVPEAPKASKCKHIIGYVLRLCGVPMAEMIAEMLCKDKKVVSSHYLYGVPSESGNIGLRSGGTVTYYDGAVLPKILEVEGCSCAFIEKPFMMRTWYTLFLTPAIAYGKTAEGEWCFGWAAGSVNYALLDNEWKSRTELTNGALHTSPDSSTILWTNTDLLNEDGTVGRKGTDPIPVGEIVDTINNIPIYEDLR